MESVCYIRQAILVEGREHLISDCVILSVVTTSTSSDRADQRHASVFYAFNVICVYSINLEKPPYFVLRLIEVNDGAAALAMLVVSSSLTAFAEVFATVLISWKVWYVHIPP